jgi:hypothetical protein
MTNYSGSLVIVLKLKAEDIFWGENEIIFYVGQRIAVRKVAEL